MEVRQKAVQQGLIEVDQARGDACIGLPFLFQQTFRRRNNERVVSFAAIDHNNGFVGDLRMAVLEKVMKIRVIFFFLLFLISRSAAAVGFPAGGSPASCPAGQFERWTVGSVTTYFNPGVNCANGKILSSASSFFSSCANVPAAGTPSPVGGNWTGDANGYYQNSGVDLRVFTYVPSTPYLYAAASLTCASSACPSGETSVGGVCQSSPNACGDTTKVLLTGSLNGVEPTGSTWCVSGCKVNRLPVQSAEKFGLYLSPSGSQPSGPRIVNEGNASTLWKSNGASCDMGDPVASSTSVATNGVDTVALTSDGCGLVNGSKVCASDLPSANGCVVTANGQFFCGQSAPTPPVPKMPGTGTPTVPAVPATPNGEITKTVPGGATTVTNIYNSTTVAASGSGTTSGGGSGGATGGATGGTTGGSCGGPGQPICAVSIDGTGIPGAVGGNSFDGLFPNVGQATDDFEAQLNAGGGGASNNLSGLFDGFKDIFPTGGTCTSIEYEVHGVMRMIPGMAGCNLLERLKEIGAWVMMMLCAVSGISRVTRAIGGGGK